ncbi:hypothetical protein BDY19DRAFT_593272 [Irpex rosettiformis]|uniref:Uncharacterized protein n=1 Tax=Irpex rosettiformis TaxID=378272 RepID=A0ACB8UD95_9APHY|nr:hypothetical protein BDY19DRAFT_593272 [Irpex rosettiformis]
METNHEPEHHHFMSIPGELGGFIVPQKVYTPPSSNFTYSPEETITFGDTGVHLAAASTNEFLQGDFERTGMTDGIEIAPLIGNSDKVTVKILWPGCQSYDTTISVREMFQGIRRNITKAKLAHRVAKAINKFLNPENRTRSESWEEADRTGWNPDDIPLGRLILFELRHVSSGSYQPVLLLIHEPTPNALENYPVDNTPVNDINQLE